MWFIVSSSLTVQLGDRVQLRCSEGSYSNAVGLVRMNSDIVIGGTLLPFIINYVGRCKPVQLL